MREYVYTRLKSYIINKGWFYIKSVSCPDVIEPHSLSVNTGVRLVVHKQRFGIDADSQLWHWDEGFLINKASKLALDYEEGYIRTFHRVHACQNARKLINDASTQLWVLLKGGFIANQKKSVLDIRRASMKGPSIIIHRRKRKHNDNQRWLLEPEIEH
ncbi:9980_t:CDS:2 [Ambispora gerdemannii]|uniref:9980_t:CDS:1 n=1 Tax=Ambispora gerdemannii TaxID=144530 RepID=A0A9N9BKY6_9GLOM|nr:9980_t:CDS:2 [Ambispora gerdemannii]